jgi:hypothetical protein
MVKLLTVVVAILSIAVPLAGCTESRSVSAGNNVPAGDEAETRATLDAFFDALREHDYDKAASYVAGTDGMSDEDRRELGSSFMWMRFAISGFTGETFDYVTVTDSTATASYTRKTTDEDGSTSFSVELDLKKEAGQWKIDLS